VNLAIDFGNTRIKAGLFRNAELLDLHHFRSAEHLLNALDVLSNAERCVLGSVTRDHEGVIGLLPSKMQVLLFSHETKTPLKNRYKSAMTLGSDRLAAANATYALYPHEDVLTIDAGTCIKYNFVNAADEYLGGGISPGIRMRLSAMNTQTSALPLIDADFGYQKLIGTSTGESLLTGALVGAACEIDGMVDRYLEKYPKLRVVLTGGDADYLAPQLKSRFFAHQNLVLHGLNHILRFNIPHQH
jgi:type III pantothenate kinase